MGAGIGGVDGGVGEAIEGHGGGAGGEHGDDDPEELVSGGKAGGGEHGSAESEGESENGVLPLDHFEGDAQVVEDGHRKIVEQNSCQLPVAGSQNSELVLSSRKFRRDSFAMRLPVELQGHVGMQRQILKV